jgi:hypothetical protein
MKKMFLILLVALSLNCIFGLTAGDIAIIAVNTDATKSVVFVSLANIPANTTISFSDNAWNATTGAWRTGEGTIAWSNTSDTPAGTIVTLTLGTTYTTDLGSVTTNTNFNLSASGDQILAYEGATPPDSNLSATWLYGFSIESFVWGNNSNTSDIPTALIGYSVAMTTSTTEVDNAYFANGSSAQASVSVSGTKAELLALFNDSSKYYQNNTGPLTIPSYSVTVNTGGGNPTVNNPVIVPGSSTHYTPFEATITCGTEGATIYYTDDGFDPDDGSYVYSSPISITGNTVIKAIAYADGYDPSAVATATYTFPVINDVADIATLRAGTIGTTVYRLTGEAVLTFKQTANNQKWLQDNTAAIMIHDPAGIITTSYNVGDGITNLMGTLTDYNGLLELLPVTDPGAATSTDNPVIPEERTLASLTGDDQSKLIKVLNVTLDTALGSFGTVAQNINATDPTATLVLRTFPNTSYSSTPIPATPQNITCLVGQYVAAMQISPRYITDFEEFADYPQDVPVVVGDVTILVTGGSANDNPTGIMPEWSNPGFVPANSFVFTLFGAGPWTITITTDAAWGAYYRNGAWTSVENVGGTLTFNIDAAKDIDIPIVMGPVDPTLPIELSSFTAMFTAENYVTLSWVTQSETDAQGYYIYRGASNQLSNAMLISPMIDATNTSSIHNYKFTDSELTEDGTYYYWLQNLDMNGNSSFHGPISVNYSTNGGDPETPEVTVVTQLKGIFPNPFNPNTNISYVLAKSADVNFQIYNSRGQLVRTIAIGTKDAGTWQTQWNGIDNNGRVVGTGVYLVKMQAGNQTFMRKAVLMK